MNYKEVIKRIVTIDQKAQFLAVTYDESDNHFYIYLIANNEADEKNIYITCHIEGGILFDSVGVEDVLSLDEDQPTISKLYFKPFDNSLDIMGMVTEHVLFKLFPILPDPETIWSPSEKMNFFKLAKHNVIKEFGEY